VTLGSSYKEKYGLRVFGKRLLKRIFVLGRVQQQVVGN
jgi:hypothetical protein